MLFHVAINVRVPHDLDRVRIKELEEKEHARAADLQRSGKWLHLWRVVGQWSNVSVFDVESGAELHDILASLPLRPFMELTVTPLCRHPGAITA